jgi:hypothetical protein
MVCPFPRREIDRIVAAREEMKRAEGKKKGIMSNFPGR